MFELKPLSPKAIPRALEKVERYRLLNEPEEAESICLDVLAIDPDHQEALVMLLLALSDQLATGGGGERFARAHAVLPRLQNEYERLYYAGLLCERRGNAYLTRGGHGCSRMASEWLYQALDWYEQAEAIRPADNDDSILRWNTCARLITKHHLARPTVEAFEPLLLE